MLILTFSLLLVVLYPSLVTSQNGSGSGMFNSSDISMLTPTSTTALVIAPSTSATGNINPSPLVGTRDYITSGQSSLFVGSQCSCDLAVESCDPNCCCDNDCSNQLGTFTQCIDIQDTQDDRLCISDDAITRSSISLRTERVTNNNNNLFCVYRDNNPSRQEYSSIDPVTSLASLQNLLGVHARPGDLFISRENLDATFYKVGDPILAMRNGLLAHMILPRPLNNGQCGYHNPIGYLQSVSVSCEHHMTSHDWCTSLLSIRASTFTDILILKLPSQNDTVAINRICYNASGLMVDCTLVAMPTSNNTHCNNVLMTLEYHISENGTDGIEDVDAVITVADVAMTTTRIDQLFSVQFLQSTQAANILHRSGNRGYQTGQPVLAGNSLQGRILLNSDPSDWLVVSNSNQDCELASSIPVLFGEDVDTSCDLNITDSINDCAQVAAMATTFFAKYIKQYIGSYGNSNPDEISEWIDVIGYNESSNDVVTGSNACVGVATTLQLLILFGYTGSASYPDVKIVGAQYSYVATTVKTQQCSSLSCQGDQFVTLHSHVSFIDVSDTPTTILKRTTNIIRKLPEDFFYPFLSPALFPAASTHLVLLLVAISILIGYL